MKHLKTKLVSAIAMLAVAAIMMTSATYAWFTISTAPEIAGVSAQVTANGNLEIALDNGNHQQPSASAVGDYGVNTTWGNMIDTSSFFNDADIVLKPVQCSLSSSAYPTFSFPVYGTDGRIKRLDALTAAKSSSAITSGAFTDVGGVKLYTSSSAYTSFTADEASDSSSIIYAFEIDYWLRTNSSANIILQSSGIERDDNNMPVGGGSTLSNSQVSIIMTIKSGSVYTNYEAQPDENGVLTLHEIEFNADGTATAKTEEAKIPMTANQAVEVRLYVFMNGSDITNANVALELTDFTMNIQFASEATLEAMDVIPE